MRYRKLRLAEVCVAEDRGWTGLGISQPSAQSHVEDLRSRQAMGLLQRRQSASSVKLPEKQAVRGKHILQPGQIASLLGVLKEPVSTMGHPENQTQPQNRSAATIVGFGADASQNPGTSRERRKRAGLSNPQWHPLQRHQPAAPAVETSRAEAGHTLAPLAHAPAHSCHAVPGGRGITKGCKRS